MTKSVILKYKLVRRAEKWCVRVKGAVNTADSFRFCHDRKMSYHIKQHWTLHRPRMVWDWDYDFIFDKGYEATAFIMGYLA
jgi:hypothetical protein